MRQHAFVVEAQAEEGVEVALSWAARELGMQAKHNPDVIVLRYGLFSVVDARRVFELAAGAPLAGAYKVLVISASRLYHEAQNALLKLFEEPPEGMHLFLILPTLGGLLPTLRSRVTVLATGQTEQSRPPLGEGARAFLKASKAKRSALIKKLAGGKDEEDRRENRDEAIAIVDGVEAVAYDALRHGKEDAVIPLLRDIATLRSYLYDRSVPVRLFLEHLSLVTPEDLL